MLGPTAQAILVFHDLTDFMPGPPQLHAKPIYLRWAQHKVQQTMSSKNDVWSKMSLFLPYLQYMLILLPFNAQAQNDKEHKYAKKKSCRQGGKGTCIVRCQIFVVPIVFSQSSHQNFIKFPMHSPTYSQYFFTFSQILCPKFYS